MTSLLLASASPRRLDLLQAVGFAPHILPAHTEEIWPANTPAAQAVLQLARDKLQAAQNKHGPALPPGIVVDAAVWLAADTVVVCGATVFGKPEDNADAARMLQALSGRTHEVITGFVVARGGQQHAQAVCTRVQMRVLSAGDVRRYVDTGEPRGKAGAYAIQGVGQSLVADVHGSLSNVIGLPLAEVLQALQLLGLQPDAA